MQNAWEPGDREGRSYDHYYCLLGTSYTCLIIKDVHCACWACSPNKNTLGTSLVVQQLRLHTPNTEILGLIPDQGIRSYITQLRPGATK